MNRTGHIGIISLAVLVAGCVPKQNPDDKPGGGVEPQGPVTLTLTASFEELSNGRMTWQEGDRIAVLQSDGVVVPFTLSSGAGTDSAVFTGELDGKASAVWAGYPYWDGAWSKDGFSVPASAIEWNGNKSVPAIMKGTISGDSVSFTHQGGVLHFPIKDVPSGARKFKFSASDNAVYGDNTFILDFTPVPGVMDFYVPVSAGTIPSCAISLCDASGNAIISKTKSSSTSAQRCELRSITPLQVVESNRLRIIEYNVQEGMKADEDNNYNNFVAWVQSQSPDVLVLCEAKSSSSGKVLNTMASSWGHPYTAVVNKDAFPVVVSSSLPIMTREVINTAGKVSHGAVYVDVAGLNLVGLHLLPTQDKDVEPNKYEYYGARRVEELNYILEQTINKYSSNTEWVFLGDFNMMAYGEKSATGAVGGNAYYYPDYQGNRSVAYNVYDTMTAKGLADVLYSFNGGIFQPTMYQGRSRLDYIFTSPSVYSRVRSARVVRGGFPGNYTTASSNPNPSDHLPLLMDISDYSFKVLDGKTSLEDWNEENLYSEYLR